MGSASEISVGRSTLGSYRLLGETGRDLLGVLTLACPAGATNFPNWAVVRQLHPGVARDPAMVHSFLAATQVAIRMVHRNIATTFDFGGKTSIPWSAREHLVGVSAVDVVTSAVAQRTRVPWPLASHIVVEACEGITALRARTPPHGPPMGLLTGAVPPNLTLTRKGEVKIVDGCLPLFDGRPVVDSVALPYRQPDDAPEGSLGARSDVFGLGVLLWELVAGRRLFAGQNDDETARLLAAMVIPPVKTPARAPALIDELVLRALGQPVARAPAFETAAELGNELRALLIAQGKRVGRDDIARFLDEVCAPLLAEQESALSRAWERERELQTEGVSGGDVTGESELTLPQTDTLPDMTTETEIVRRPQSRRGAVFDDLPTVPLLRADPSEPGPSWRASTPSPPRFPRDVESLSETPVAGIPSRNFAVSSSRLVVTPPYTVSGGSAPTISVTAETEVALPPEPRLHATLRLNEPAVIVAPTSSHAFPLPPIERGGLVPLPMPPPARPASSSRPHAVPFTPPPVSAREATATRVVRSRSRSSPMVVGGVAFAISFLAIAIFGATHRGSSAPEAASSASVRAVPTEPFPAVTRPVATPLPVGAVSPWSTPPVPSASAWTTLTPVPVQASLPPPSPPPEPIPAPVPTVPPPVPPPAAPDTPTHVTATRARVPLAHPPAASSGRLGLLTVFCTPACDEVFDGGRALGPSPVFKQLVSAGVHRLRLRVDSTEKKVTVTVSEGETLVVRENVGD